MRDLNRLSFSAKSAKQFPLDSDKVHGKTSAVILCQADKNLTSELLAQVLHGTRAINKYSLLQKNAHLKRNHFGENLFQFVFIERQNPLSTDFLISICVVLRPFNCAVHKVSPKNISQLKNNRRKRIVSTLPCLE